MSFVALQSFDGVEGGFESLDELASVDEPEVMRCQGRQQPHADVRGRRPASEAPIRRLLEVVGREPVARRADEQLEVVPRPPGNLAEAAPVLGAKDPDRRRHRAAEEIRADWGGNPQRDER